MGSRISKVFVANRGEIAVRVVRTCRAMGLDTVVAVSTADRDGMVARMAGRSVCIGPAPARQSYLDIPSVISAAVGTGCDALHPGYGFLSENPDLARACVDNGLTFVGPSPDVIAEAGDKVRAREIARRAGIPVLAGSPIVAGPEEAVAAADALGYPVLVKASGGGGGRGMVVIRHAAELRARLAGAMAEAESAFGDGRVYIERFIENARHIEVQVLGDRHGNVVHLGERDCTLQRRHQKVIEESPAANITEETRQAIRASGVAFARAIDLDNAGTVEFIYDADRGQFSFLEFNARIQVEHPVTEMITGVDLVRQQFRSAQGERLDLSQADVSFRGHAIEMRITCESVPDGFVPRPGTVTLWESPIGPGSRIDTHMETGYVISPHYDSLLAKLVVWGADRDEAIRRSLDALTQLKVEGVPTTAEFAHFAIDHPDFRSVSITTDWIARCGLPQFQDRLLKERRP